MKHGKSKDVQRMFQRLQAEAKSLIEECVHIAFYMRGSIQYEDVLLRTFVERQIMMDFISEKKEQAAKNPMMMPFMF